MNNSIITISNLELMFKVIELDLVKCSCSNNNIDYLHQLENSDLITNNENYNRTLAGFGDVRRLDLSKRSSWTHNSMFRIPTPPEAQETFNLLQILSDDNFDSYELLRYETGDFFLNHNDTQNAPNHQYTCLIFCPFGNVSGGELVFNHPDGLYNIKFNPSEIARKQFVMVIFSLDMFHEVLPIIKGTRWVLKKPLFVKETDIIINEKDIRVSVETPITATTNSKLSSVTNIFRMISRGFSKLFSNPRQRENNLADGAGQIFEEMMNENKKNNDSNSDSVSSNSSDSSLHEQVLEDGIKPQQNPLEDITDGGFADWARDFYAKK